MPLLGRHKSLPSSGQTGGHKQPSSPPVCESPLFGTRRQLPVSSQPAAAQAPGKHQSLAAKSSLGSGGGAASSRAHSLDTSETLASIPKQISRQQIHYAFSIMDTNSDGLIDLRDLSQMLANLGVPIDEAILSHVMSSVSKRGDHRISEAEFLDWLGNFIQVSDLKVGGGGGAREAPERGGSAARRPAGGRLSSAIVRSASSSTTSALVAQSAEERQLISQQANRRRGSGSGLALMRSLSSSSAGATSAAAAGATSGASETGKQQGANSQSNEAGSNGAGGEKLQTLAELQQEARDDLKAAFCVFDLDGDGFITIDEVQQGLKLLGESWSQAELNRLLFSKCDSQRQTQLAAASKKQNSAASSAARTKRAAADLSGKQQAQRISIEDFVELLL